MNLVLPDVSAESSLTRSYHYPLDWVGMEKIALPLYLENSLCQSQVNAYVSLNDVFAKGIHMSRLYTRLLKLSTIKNLALLDIKDD